MKRQEDGFGLCSEFSEFRGQSYRLSGQRGPDEAGDGKLLNKGHLEVTKSGGGMVRSGQDHLKPGWIFLARVGMYTSQKRPERLTWGQKKPLNQEDPESTSGEF